MLAGGLLAQKYTHFELEALDTGLLGGRFELQELLNSGATADVYLATDRSLGRQVAIKLLHPDLVADGSFAKRFEREAHAAAALSHPNVVAVFDCGVADVDDLLWSPSRRTAAPRGISRTFGRRNVPFIVMEYVSGPNLKAVIRERAPLPEIEALDFAIQTAAALDAAHARGLVHRNVKPENLLLAANGAIKVTDFGLARALGEAQVTVTRTVLGTAQYASPEQTLGRLVDGRSDLYSLGAILYEFLTGRVPFVGESVVAVAWQHIYDAPVPPRQLRPELSPAAEDVVLRALAKDSAHRFQTAAEMGAALKQASSRPNGHLPVARPVARPGPEAGVSAERSAGGASRSDGTTRATEMVALAPPSGIPGGREDASVRRSIAPAPPRSVRERRPARPVRGRSQPMAASIARLAALLALLMTSLAAGTWLLLRTAGITP